MGPKPDDCKEIDLFNRMIRWKGAFPTAPEFIKSSPRHVQILLGQFWLENCNPVTPHAVKPLSGLFSGRHLLPSEFTDI